MERYTFDKMHVAGQPSLFILKDKDRFMGSLHCSTPTAEDIVDCLNKAEKRVKELEDLLMDIRVELNSEGFISEDLFSRIKSATNKR